MTPTEARLREEIDTLRERVRQLEGLLREPLPCALHGVLSPMEVQIMQVLLRRENISTDGLRMAVGSRSTGRDTISILVHRIRRKLASRNIEICSRRFLGYYMPPASKAIVRQMMTQPRLDAAE